MKNFFLALSLLLILLGVFILNKPNVFPKTENISTATSFFYQHPEDKPERISQMSTNNYILVDLKTNQILLASDIHSPIYPASTTKLATAVMGLNIFPKDKIVEIESTYKEGKVMGLHLGEKITIENLVSALLVYSANDAAYAIASSFTGGREKFVDYMNQKAKSLNMHKTNFTNVDGVDNQNHVSTVYDLSQLGRYAASFDLVRNIVKMPEIKISSFDGKYKYTLATTNELLYKEPEIQGLKTGWTPVAGEAFVGLIAIDNHEYISVVANSTDRFGDTKKILNWLRQKHKP